MYKYVCMCERENARQQWVWSVRTVEGQPTTPGAVWWYLGSLLQLYFLNVFLHFAAIQGPNTSHWTSTISQIGSSSQVRSGSSTVGFQEGTKTSDLQTV